MKQLFTRCCLLLLALFSCFPSVAQVSTSNWLWAVQASSPTAGNSSVTQATTTDAAGNIYITGRLYGPATFGSIALTGTGGFVAKLSAAGQWQWAIPFAGNGNGSQVAVDASGTVYVGGVYRGPVTFGPTTLVNRGIQDVFVARLSATGQWLGAARAGGPQYTFCSGLVVNGSDVYVAGSYQVAVAFDNLTTLSSTPASSNGFVAKLSAAGQWQWATNLEAYANDFGQVLAFSAATTELYVALGMNRPSGTFGPTTLTRTAGGVVVVRLSPATGAIEGAVQGGVGIGDDAQALTTDSQGRLIVTGAYAGGQATFGSISLSAVAGTGHAYIACLNPATQTWAWASPINGVATIRPTALAAGRNADVCLVGYYQGTITRPAALSSASTGSGFLLRFDGTGTLLLADRTTGTGGASITGVGVDSGGQLYVGGSFRGSLTFGTTTLVNTSTGLNPDCLFIAKTGLLLGSRRAAAAEPLGLFPNPAQQTATLLLPQHFPTTGGEVRIHNALGQLVYQQQLPAGATRLALSVERLATGSYVVQVHSGAQQAWQRLLVE